MSGQPSAKEITSVPHFHNADSGCLERIPAIATGEHREGKPVTAPSEHWYRCTHLADLERTAPWRGVYEVHQHGPAFCAHETRQPCEFPR